MALFFPPLRQGAVVPPFQRPVQGHPAPNTKQCTKSCDTLFLRKLGIELLNLFLPFSKRRVLSDWNLHIVESLCGFRLLMIWILNFKGGGLCED